MNTINAIRNRKEADAIIAKPERTPDYVSLYAELMKFAASCDDCVFRCAAECHAAPPTVDLDGHAVWPQCPAAPRNWCGRWRQA